MTGARSGIILRGLVGTVVLMLAVWSGYEAWIAFARGTDPEAVLRVRPDDALALAKTFDRRSRDDQTAAVSASEEMQARGSLARQPLSRTSLRLIGLAASSRGDMVSADRAMALSDRVSRRDGPAQFWLIERSVQKQDIRGALAHYHVVLSVFPRSRTTLFPILTAALDSADIRRELAPYIVRETNWSVALLGAAAGEGDFRNVARLLFPIARSLRGQAFQVTNALLVSRLTRDGDAALAKRFVRAVWPEVPASAFAFGVTGATTDARLGALAWSFNTQGAVVGRDNGAGGIDINAAPLASGTVATRIMQVEGHRSYLFAQRTAGNGSASIASTVWRAYCLTHGARTLIWEHVAPSGGPVADRSRIEVPKGCGAVEFVLTAAGGDGQDTAGALVDSLELRVA